MDLLYGVIFKFAKKLSVMKLYHKPVNSKPCRRVILYIFLLHLLFLSVPGYGAPKISNPDLLEKVKGGQYYTGTVNKKVFFIRFDKAGQKGEFFFVDDRRRTTLEKFDYRFIGQKLIVDYGDKIHTVHLAGKQNEGTFIGAVSVRKKFLGIFPILRKEYMFTLNSFNDPVARLKQDRYREQVFPRVSVEKDIIYGRAGGYRTSVDCENPPKFWDNLPSLLTKQLDLKMDIYSPEGDTLKRRPLVLLIHGGGFYIGNKECRTIADLSEMLAGEGFVVAAIDYRIGFQPTKPAIKRSGYRAIQDGRAALRFLSYYKDRYRVDPMNVSIMGTSAGAITSLNIAFLDDNERPDESKGSLLVDDEGCIDCTGNNFKSQFRIKSVVNMWGAVHSLEIIDSKSNIPVLSVHGDQDITVPYENDYPFKEYSGYKLLVDKMFGSKLIDEHLKKLNIKSELITFRGFPHEPHLTENVFNPNYDVIKSGIRSFLYKNFSDELDREVDKIQVAVGEDNCSFGTEGVSTGFELFWEASGGFVLEQDNNHADVIWFENIQDHRLSVVVTDPFRFQSKKTEVSLN